MGRLASLGHNWLYRHEYRSVADDLATLRAITTADIRRLGKPFSQSELAQTVEGMAKA